jgi:hypothetical protein
MKTILKPVILIVLLSLSTGLYAQNRLTDTSATCIAFWKNKQGKILQITHGKERYDSVGLKAKSEVAYEAHIKIIDSAAEGFTVEWVYKNFKSSDLSEQSSSGINGIMEGLKILYKTDDVGSFLELINWKEVSAFAFNAIDQMVKTNPENKNTTAALNQVKAMFQSKENIEAVLIKEVQLYHSPYGVEYSLNGMPVETQLPNVTGGAPFPATITIKLNEVNTQNDYCKVSLNQTIDKGKAGPIIAAMLKKLAGSANQNEQKMRKQIESMEISDVNEFTYAISSGWIKKVLYKRTTNVGDVKQVESYLITEKK